jgi:D-serine deaminase-like pyridoxal phosphate-dependent protein
MTADDLLDPMIGPGFKGFPHGHAPLRRSAVAQAGWNVLAGDLPLPVAVLKRDAVAHNVDWLQRQARQWGIDLAPHGKTTMSPQLFRRQLDAGAWGITFATVTQLAVGVAAGVRRALIANQVLDDARPGRAWPAADARPCRAACGLPRRLRRTARPDRGLGGATRGGRAGVRGAARTRPARRAHRLPHARRGAGAGAAAARQRRRCGSSASSATKAWARRATARSTCPTRRR